jgi:hypothetical protein
MGEESLNDIYMKSILTQFCGIDIFSYDTKLTYHIIIIYDIFIAHFNILHLFFLKSYE